MSSTSPQPSSHAQQSVLDYWLRFDIEDPDALQRQWRFWFSSDPQTDREIARRFGDLVALAARQQLSSWADSAEGRLALILLLDQFPRNLHRGTAAAFAHDSQALALTQRGIEAGADRDLPPLARIFFYMPLQHAESAQLQRQSVTMFEALSKEPAPPHVAAALAESARFARMHADIIDRFGRFPHRNAQLCRISTPAENAYLAAGGATFGQSSGKTDFEETLSA